ncbi:MAG: branched-chain amino acid transport system substrate-binding protein [Actinomycetota bacterium]|jgi:branched-chain amino acid transport system substrate-binding protein|nr:branched-chain amino acid transport system substrate-binding protein [Actinomycetota bacterium]
MMVSRRLRSVALVAVLMLLAVSCSNKNNNSASGGSNCTWTIGTMGALSGPAAALGQVIEQGVAYAVDSANKKGGVPCKLSLLKEDSQGDPTQAPGLARKLAQTSDLVAVVGPYFSGESNASGPLFNQAGIPFITPSATDPAIAQHGWNTFFRAVANDADQGPVAAQYIGSVLKPSSVAVIDDNSDYGKTLAGIVASGLNSSGTTVQGPYHIDPKSNDYSAVVAQVKNANPQAVYFGGYYPQAGPLDFQLKQGGVSATFVSDDGTKDPAFGPLAKTAAAGAIVTCPCADPTKLPAAQAFVTGVKAQYGRVGTFEADAFDATNLVINALKKQSGSASVTDVRSGIVSTLHGLHAAPGITKTYTFKSDGNLVVDPARDIWIYKWSTPAKDFKSVGPSGKVISGG